MTNDERQKLIRKINIKKNQTDECSVQSLVQSVQEFTCDELCKYREDMTQDEQDEVCLYCPIGWLD